MSDDDDGPPPPPPPPSDSTQLRGVQRRRGVRTRGGTVRKTLRIPPKPVETWETWENIPFSPVKPKFTNSSGPNQPHPGNVTESVNTFLTDEVIEFIAEQTNLYAAQYLEKTDITKGSRVHQWKPVTIQVIYFSFSMQYVLGQSNDKCMLTFFCDFISGHTEVYWADRTDESDVKTSYSRLLEYGCVLSFARLSCHHVQE